MVTDNPIYTSLRGESNDRRELDSTKQSVEIQQNVNGLLRRSFVAPRNDDATSKILEILGTVMDPEIPTLSVIDLGMITGIAMSDDGVVVRLLPTFVACPATSYIRANITDALAKSGFADAKVEMETELSWSSDRVTEHGRKLLEAFGLGAPVQIDGILSLDMIEHVDCPHCGSANTTLRSMFGSTLCRSIHYCNDCKQGFERFKPL
jgi:ring-1,2-phenylacetyl-CoA epoxidase subunit PaaD